MTCLIEKTCTQCGTTKSPDGFYNRKAECKTCSIARTRRWQAEHSDQLREYKRTAPAAKACAKRAYERNRLDTEFREKRNQHSREWRANNRERHRACSREWAEKNPEKHRANQRRHARLRRLGVKGLDAEYANLLVSDPCSYCGESGGQVDHIVPVAVGGSNDWSNLTAACAICNTFKNAEASLLAFLLRVPHLPAERDVTVPLR